MLNGIWKKTAVKMSKDKVFNWNFKTIVRLQAESGRVSDWRKEKEVTKQVTPDATILARICGETVKCVV